MDDRKGLLLVMMEPPNHMEEEFNDWYDTEHMPERVALPGFGPALRYVCLEGWPRYMAKYDLASLNVLNEAPYMSMSGEHYSPWTQRVTRHVRGRSRMAAVQIFGKMQSNPKRPAPRLLFLRFVGIDAARQSAWVAAM